jgi:hypothetical protein
VGLHREALRARCGPWQSRSPTGPSQMETLTYRHPDGTLLLRVIADEVVISAVVQDGPISDAERAALEQRQNRLAFERAVAAHRLDKPRALQCRQQPDMLIGLDREALRARCGPWQSRSPTTAVSGNVDELIYRESDGTLLLRVVAGEKVISATER